MTSLRVISRDVMSRKKRNLVVTLSGVIGLAAMSVWYAQLLRKRAHRARAATFDYSSRSGFPRAPEAMRGIGRDFVQRGSVPRKPEPEQPRLHS